MSSLKPITDAFRLIQALIQCTSIREFEIVDLNQARTFITPGVRFVCTNIKNLYRANLINQQQHVQMLEIVNSQIDSHYTVEEYLTRCVDKKFNGDEAPVEFTRAVRVEWLKQLIECLDSGVVPTNSLIDGAYWKVRQEYSLLNKTM